MRPRAPLRNLPLPAPDVFCLNVARVVVEEGDKLGVATVEGSQLVVVELTVPPDEVGRLVGRDGRTIAAIRILAEALGTRIGKRIMVDVQSASRRPG